MGTTYLIDTINPQLLKERMAGSLLDSQSRGEGSERRLHDFFCCRRTKRLSEPKIEGSWLGRQQMDEKEGVRSRSSRVDGKDKLRHI